LQIPAINRVKTSGVAEDRATPAEFASELTRRCYKISMWAPISGFRSGSGRAFTLQAASIAEATQRGLLSEISEIRQEREIVHQDGVVPTP